MPSILTRRGWENHGSWFVKIFNEVVNEHSGYFDYMGLKDDKDYERHVEELLSSKENKLERKIQSYTRYYIMMNDAVELFRPKRNWINKKIYNLKMWAIKKLMGYKP